MKLVIKHTKKEKKDYQISKWWVILSCTCLETITYKDTFINENLEKNYIRLARFEWNVKTYPGKLKYIYIYIYEILIVLYNLLNIVGFVRFQLQ